MHMLHHISLCVRDIHASGALYDAMLAPLGYVRVWEDLTSENKAIGYGPEGGGDKLALKHVSGDVAFTPGPRFHLALSAPNTLAVDAFYEAARRGGAVCNGPPGWRPAYGQGYYAAFVYDLDGHNIEAVINKITLQ